MDGDDHEHTVISAPRELNPAGAGDDPDPGGLVDDTIPRRVVAAVIADRPDDRPRSTHAETAAPQAVARALPRYRFRLNGGEPIPTDTPTFIGRSPRPPRVPGPQSPRLVRVDSPSNEVSGTHLALRQEGSTVIVSDLRSTNGTVVTMPGAASLRMLPGESIVAVPGSLIDIGDENVVEILGIERQAPSDVRGRLIP